jgi:PTH1 family peptidyl-tRNA hydrolase
MLLLVLGLGNAGGEYQGTRHNIGFEVLDLVARKLGAQAQPETREYYWAVRQSGVGKLILAWPRLLMNRSGLAAQVLLQRYDVRSSAMLVVVDDFNLPLGRLRFRSSGADGGHNGLASIIELLQTEGFPRLRLGIGPPPDNVDRAEYVLRGFDQEELEAKEKMIAVAAEAVLFAVDHRLDEAMKRYIVNPA